MKLSEITQHLSNLSNINFQLPDGSLVPSHFHVSEIGKIDKTFIDCGGTVRTEKVVNFQLWSANDYDHRLHPEKLVHIIDLARRTLQLGDWDVEVEYQGDTIQKFGIEDTPDGFLLTAQQTDCLAKEACGIPKEKPKVRLSQLNTTSCCEPSSGCC